MELLDSLKQLNVLSCWTLGELGEFVGQHRVLAWFFSIRVDRETRRVEGQLDMLGQRGFLILTFDFSSLTKFVLRGT